MVGFDLRELSLNLRGPVLIYFFPRLQSPVNNFQKFLFPFLHLFLHARFS